MVNAQFLLTLTCLTFSSFALHAAQNSGSRDLKDGDERKRTAAAVQAVAGQAQVQIVRRADPSVPSMKQILMHQLPMLHPALCGLCAEYICGIHGIDMGNFLVCGCRQVLQLSGLKRCNVVAHKDKIIVVSVDESNYIHLHELNKGKLIDWTCKLEHNRCDNPHVAFYCYGGRLSDGIHLWDIETGKLIVCNVPHYPQSISADGTKIVLKQPDNVYVRDVNTQETTAMHGQVRSCKYGLLEVLHADRSKGIYKLSLHSMSDPENCLCEFEGETRLIGRSYAHGNSHSHNKYSQPEHLAIINDHTVLVPASAGLTARDLSAGQLVVERTNSPLHKKLERLFSVRASIVNFPQDSTPYVIAPQDGTLYILVASALPPKRVSGNNAVKWVNSVDYVYALYAIDMQLLVQVSEFEERAALGQVLDDLLSMRSENRPIALNRSQLAVLEKLQKFSPALYENIVNFFQIQSACECAIL